MIYDLVKGLDETLNQIVDGDHSGAEKFRKLMREFKVIVYGGLKTMVHRVCQGRTALIHVRLYLPIRVKKGKNYKFESSFSECT